MAEPARKLVTVAEFLRFEGEGDRRYQLIGGEIVMMAPPARLHGILAARIVRRLGDQLRPPREPQNEAGIVLPWTDTSYYVADVAVTCASVAPEPWCPDPIVIVEVLVLIAGMTPLPHQKAWRQALSSPPLVTLAKHIRPWLPDALSERIHFE